MIALAAALVLGQLVRLAPVEGSPTTLALTDRTEVRLRSQYQGGQAVDFETAAGGALSLLGRHRSLTLSYVPRFSYLDLEGDRNLALMHTGRLDGAWWTRRLRLTAAVDGSIGRQTAIGLVAPINLSGGGALSGGTLSGGGTPVAPDGGPPVPVAPQAAPAFFPELLVLETASVRGTAGATYALSRRWTGGASAFFAVAGGLDYDSQQFLPPYRNPGGDLTAAYSASRRDQLVSRLHTSYLWTLIAGGDFLTVEATETIRHVWSRRTQTTLGGGLLLLRSRENARDRHTGAITGAGNASITNTTPLGHQASLLLRASAMLDTAYNPVLGVVQKQASGSVATAVRQGPLLVTLSGEAAATLPVDSPLASRVISGALVGAFTVSQPLTLEAGGRAYTQLLPASAGAAIPAQWVAFVAVTVRSPVLAL